MIYTTFEEGEIRSNGFYITNLKKPFRKIIQSPIAEIRQPTKTFETKRGVIRSSPVDFYVQIKRNTYGVPFRGSPQGFPSHWIYETNSSVSSLFKDRTLHQILNEEGYNEKIKEDIKEHIRIIVNLLFHSYPFDTILTDIKMLSTFTSSYNIVRPNLNLLSIPTTSSLFSIIKALIKGHGSLPLSALDWQVLRDISLLKNTTFQKKTLENSHRVLILCGTNTYYAGFLATELRKISFPLNLEILPVTLFKVI